MGGLQIYILQSAFWVSGAVFSYSAEKRKHFWIRSALIILIVLLQSVGFRVLWDGQPSGELLAKSTACGIMVIFLLGVWENSLSVAVNNTIWAVSIWQLLLENWKMIRIFLNYHRFDNNSLYASALCVLLFAVVYGICAGTIAVWMPKDRKKGIGPRQTVSAILIFCIIEMLAYSPIIRDMDNYNSDWKFLYMSQLLCVVILYMQNELFKKAKVKQELDVMSLLWEKTQEQYLLSRENIELLNQKSHDLKHQIRALRNISKEDMDAYLDEIEENVSIYEAIVKTGNHVLDTILTEKSLYCKDRGIQVSCVADGSQMDFIDTVDLYAILGNALDNAVEAVEKFQEIEKRQIDVLIYREQNFLIMNFINPMPGKLVYEGEFPVTTKGDKRFHGFGLRSIWHLVRRYDGFLNISEEDGCFSLKILIPIPGETKERENVM